MISLDLNYVKHYAPPRWDEKLARIQPQHDSQG